MAIIGRRQAKLDCAGIPTVERGQKVDIRSYTSIRQALTESIYKKNEYQYQSKDILVDCLNQTIHILKKHGASSKTVKNIILWEKWVKMTPELEALNVGISSMLIKHHYPKMASEIAKGHVYSHTCLTGVNEAVLYCMEYFYKEGLIK